VPRLHARPTARPEVWSLGKPRTSPEASVQRFVASPK
jgi:hypothetical protein